LRVSFNAVTVVLLAAITFWYAKSAKRQAEAARQQASAAQQQATAASATLATLRQQMEDTAEIGKTVMVASIDSTLRRIEEWEPPGKLATAANQGALPYSIAWVPANEVYVIESARRVSRDFALRLAGAFDYLRGAAEIVNGMRMAERGRVGDDFFRYRSGQAIELLSHAKAELQRCRTDIYNYSRDAGTT